MNRSSRVHWPGSNARAVHLALGILLSCAALAAPRAAQAHQITLYALADGNTIRGHALAQGNEPVAGVTVTAYDPGGHVLARAVTDERGQFRLEAKRRVNHRLVLDAGPGHEAEFIIPAAELPADGPPVETPRPTPAEADAAALPSSPGHPDLRAELAELRSQLADLRLELQRRDQRARLSDVLGGLGWIAGVAGVVFYFLGTRRRQAGV